ncbi:MAG TPA: hypothetical protein VEZ55_13555, partial [Chitinophagaceae bacterium]|nr:hypothetical protein [Chitinophagaceae bacterium]
GGELAYILSSTFDYSSSNSFLFFPGQGNAKIGVSFNMFLYTLNFSYLVGGSLVTISVPFSHTTYGVHFKEPVTVGGYTFQDMYWDETKEVYYIRVGNNRVEITNSNTPLFPLRAILGKSISTISVPSSPLPGQSSLFAATYATIKTNLKTSGFNLDLDNMDFIFDDASKYMALNVYVRQNGTPYVVQYIYQYTYNNSNIAKFTRVYENPNGAVVEDDMMPLLDYIENDRFLLDYFTGSSPILGQFTSQERPAFFFTGNLQ